MQETLFRSLGREDPLEKEYLHTPVFWPGEFHGLYSPRGHKQSDTAERLSLSQSKNVLPSSHCFLKRADALIPDLHP